MGTAPRIDDPRVQLRVAFPGHACMVLEGGFRDGDLHTLDNSCHHTLIQSISDSLSNHRFCILVWFICNNVGSTLFCCLACLVCFPLSLRCCAPLTNVPKFPTFPAGLLC